MNSLRHIPLHMLMLAGLVGPLVAQENENAPQAPAAKVKPAAATAYAGISPAVVTELARRGVTSKDVPPGIGVMVAFVDPKGPSMGVLAEDDILVRLDDQVLVNPEQFRALIGMHKPGDVVKIVAVREDEVVNVDLKLGSRNAPVSAAPKAKKSIAPKADVKPADEPAPAQAPQAVVPPRMGITINGQTFELNQDPMQGFPPEIIEQFNEMRRRGMAVPQGPQPQPEAAPEKESAPALQSKSKSFSFSFGNGASVSSNSVASDRDGTVAIDERDGKKHAVIKDASGKVLFDGDVTTDEARAKMNPKLRDRLKLVETNSFKIQSAPVEEINSEEPVLPKKKRDPKDGA
jgi:PDZ domain